MIGSRGFAVAGLSVLTASLVAGVPSGLGASPRVSGSRVGIALLARVHASYRTVPGVFLRAAYGGRSLQYTVTLQHGYVLAESWTKRDSAGVLLLYARHGGPTYAKVPGTNCWRAVSGSSPLTVNGALGDPFPVPSGSRTIKVGPPRRSGRTLTLPLSGQGYNGQSWSEKFVIDPSTFHVREWVFSGFAVHLDILGAAPKPPVTRPRCTA